MRPGRTRETAARLRGPGSCGARGRSTRSRGQVPHPNLPRPGRVAAHRLRASARNRRKRKRRRAAQKAVALETAGGDGTPPPVELVVIDTKAAVDAAAAALLPSPPRPRGRIAYLAGAYIPRLSAAPDYEGRDVDMIRDEVSSCGPAGSRT